MKTETYPATDSGLKSSIQGGNGAVVWIRTVSPKMEQLEVLSVWTLSGQRWSQWLTDVQIIAVNKN